MRLHCEGSHVPLSTSLRVATNATALRMWTHEHVNVCDICLRAVPCTNTLTYMLYVFERDGRGRDMHAWKMFAFMLPLYSGQCLHTRLLAYTFASLVFRSRAKLVLL